MTAQLALLALANEAQKNTLQNKHSTKRAKNASSTKFVSLSLNLSDFGITPLVNSVGFARWLAELVDLVAFVNLRFA